MHIYENQKYVKEINDFSNQIDLSFFEQKTILVAGACGLVMSYLIDTLLARKKLDIKIIALVYSDADRKRFSNCDPRLSFVFGDVKDAETFRGLTQRVDVVLNGASIVDPKGYKERPVDTMLINILGTKNLLDLCVANNAAFLLTSSCEVYGDADVDVITENYCGKVDPMVVRSCYNESKRACETLCVSYSAETGIKTYVARLSRTFGPTQSPKDTKALSQFIRNGILNENIVLKSRGEQLFSYTYVQDIVSGIITILSRGKSMNAYNVCNRETLRLKEVAGIVSSIANTRVVYDLSKDDLATGYSNAHTAIQDPTKLEELGWNANVSIEKGLQVTMDVLKDTYFNQR